MKKTLIFLLILFFALPAVASQNSDFAFTQIPTDTWYIGQWDKLALDFVVPDNDGVEDTLTAVTVKNQGNAIYTHGIQAMRLWADAGEVGFQGWQVDTDLGAGTYYSPTNSWYWDDLSQLIPVDGLRLFVSAEMWETAPATNVNYTVQLQVPRLIDNDLDGAFDIGDAGVFVASESDGPTDLEFTNAANQTISYYSGDKAGPVVIFDNLEDGQTIGTNSYTITGKSRDQGKSSAEYIKIKIYKEGETVDWEDVEILTQNYATWQYDWTGIENGTYFIETQSRDWVGQVSNSGPITITVAISGEFSATNSSVSVDNLTVNADGSSKITVTVKTFDTQNNVLPSQIVYLNEVRDEGLVVVSSKGSGDNGEQTFEISSSTAQDVVYQVTSDSQNVGAQFTVHFVAVTSPAATVDYTNGTWLKLADKTAVYFIDTNNLLHPYPTQAVWESYFGNDFSFVETVNSLEDYTFGDNVPFKTGTLMKTPTIAKVYKVEDNHVIRWLKSESKAKELFGDDWGSLVKSLPEAFYTDYTKGEALE